MSFSTEDLWLLAQDVRFCKVTAVKKPRDEEKTFYDSQQAIAEPWDANESGQEGLGWLLIVIKAAMRMDGAERSHGPAPEGSLDREAARLVKMLDKQLQSALLSVWQRGQGALRLLTPPMPLSGGEDGLACASNRMG